MLKDLGIARLYSVTHASIKVCQNSAEEAEDVTWMLIEFALDIDKAMQDMNWQSVQETEDFCSCSYSPVNFNQPHFITPAHHGKLISSTIARVT